MIRVYIYSVLFIAIGYIKSIGDCRAGDPVSLDDGLDRLEQTLGKYDPVNQVEWRVKHDEELVFRNEPKKAAVLTEWHGVYTISSPFKTNNKISFDHCMQWKRIVFDVGDTGEKQMTRVQCSHSTIRYSISYVSGEWLVTGTVLTNGVHEAIGSPAFSGELKWREDGFELLGSNGVAEYYAAEGKTKLGILYGSSLYRRLGNVLKVEGKYQRYEIARSVSGALLQHPEFARPIGSEIVSSYESEPLMPLVTSKPSVDR